MRVAVLGLGIIGSRAAANLRRDPEHQVVVWNRTPKDLDGEVGTPEEAARDAQVVALYLKDGPAVREVATRVLSSRSDGAILLNHSTVDLETTRWLATECTEHGWRFLDTPFTGSRDAAAAAQLVYYVSGEPELIDRCRPLLAATSKEIIPCGEIGRATVVKLVTNLISACTVQALSEALAIATSHGIEPAALTSAVASNACGSPLAALKLPSMARGDFEPHFSLENMLKDSRYAIELAGKLDTPAIGAVSARMEQLRDSGLGSRDFSALAAAYQEPCHE
jgi:3-hydroxyisobutyrate dehydrogenase/glyoxylate/succinic semialdehyde reductase